MKIGMSMSMLDRQRKVRLVGGSVDVTIVHKLVQCVAG
jgi:hypothetical protein